MNRAQLVVVVWIVALGVLAASFNGNLRAMLHSLLVQTPNTDRIAAQEGQLILFWGIGAFLLVALAGASPRAAYLILGILSVSVLVMHTGPLTSYLKRLAGFVRAGSVTTSTPAKAPNAAATARSVYGMASSTQTH